MAPWSIPATPRRWPRRWNGFARCPRRARRQPARPPGGRRSRSPTPHRSLVSPGFTPISLELPLSSPYTAQVAGRPAVFIDRDGTLTEEVGYVNHPQRLRLLPRSAEAIRRLNERGIAAVVVTNQAGVARGYFSEEVLHAVNAALVSRLKDEGAHLDGIYVCSHHPTEGEPPYRMVCECRKPKPGLLLRAASELGLDLSGSTLVG